MTKFAIAIGLLLGIAAVGTAGEGPPPQGLFDLGVAAAKAPSLAAVDAASSIIRNYVPFGSLLVSSPAVAASQTLTPLQQKIVNAANADATNAAFGYSSGASYAVSPWGGTTTWFTDVYGTPGTRTDGMRMRDAINRYYSWKWGNPSTRGTLDAVKKAMIVDFDGPSYDPTRKQALVDEIVRVYDLKVSSNGGLRVQPPTTDQATLGFLGIRKQCLEWANSIALAQGGSARGYGSPSVANAADHRPGMMFKLITATITHAAIIVEMKTVNGVLQYRLAEANWGGGWMNPGGMIPWQRTVQNSRWVTLGANDRVISFE